MYEGISHSPVVRIHYSDLTFALARWGTGSRRVTRRIHILREKELGRISGKGLKAAIVPPSSMQTSKLFQLHRGNPEAAIFFPFSLALALFLRFSHFSLFFSLFFVSTLYSLIFFVPRFANSRLSPDTETAVSLVSAPKCGFSKFFSPTHLITREGCFLLSVRCKGIFFACVREFHDTLSILHMYILWLR